MNLFENLQTLKELADSEKNSLLRLKYYSHIRIEHLIKLFLYRFNDEFLHWCKEVANYSRRSNTKNNIKLSKLFNYSWDNIKDEYEKSNIDMIVSDLEFEGYPKVNNYNYDKLMLFLHEYHLWMCDELTKRISVSHQEVVNQMTDLLSKYPLE